jgi:hypothetical protein
MKGSIRFFLGLFIVFGAVGGIDNSVTDGELAVTTLLAVFGCFLMYSGTNAMKENA